MNQSHLHHRLFFTILFFLSQSLYSQTSTIDRLVASLLGETPLISDLQELTDEIGGRPTGSDANLRSVEWGLKKIRDTGVEAYKESFMMPALWLENSASARVSGDVSFDVNIVAMPFSVSTPSNGLTLPLVDAGFGTAADFSRLGNKVNGAFVLVETHELLDIDGLFREYREAVEIEKHAFKSGVKGVVYMSSRPMGLLYRHNASLGFENKHPMMIMEREDAKRSLRLLRKGKKLMLTTSIDINSGGPYESYNVIGEIKGTVNPEEIVVVGAHLDSWGLGTGANDNGCNVAMMIDIARQMKKLGIKPRRTIRFILWNGEEQGLIGSWQYTVKHVDELDRHVLAISIDIGSGKITGFFTNGRSDVLESLDNTLKAVKGLGPYQNINIPIVGTDNYDFMMQGIGNLVANHDPYNYGPNYHAESDTFDKVDLKQLRINTAIVAAVVYGFAQIDLPWKRQTRSQIQKLIETTDLGEQMRSMGVWKGWQDLSRGRQEE